jgi:hypothetical protein
MTESHACSRTTEWLVPLMDYVQVYVMLHRLRDQYFEKTHQNKGITASKL